MYKDRDFFPDGSQRDASLRTSFFGVKGREKNEKDKLETFYKFRINLE